ncbi:hypothetical protein QPK87_17875 [Kamptonema cortianum]|nr:hypothetical protein [Kamptonema cortianum]
MQSKFRIDAMLYLARHLHPCLAKCRRSRLHKPSVEHVYRSCDIFLPLVRLVSIDRHGDRTSFRPSQYPMGREASTGKHTRGTGQLLE